MREASPRLWQRPDRQNTYCCTSGVAAIRGSDFGLFAGEDLVKVADICFARHPKQERRRTKRISAEPRNGKQGGQARAEKHHEGNSVEDWLQDHKSTLVHVRNNTGGEQVIRGTAQQDAWIAMCCCMPTARRRPQLHPPNKNLAHSSVMGTACLLWDERRLEFKVEQLFEINIVEERVLHDVFAISFATAQPVPRVLDEEVGEQVFCGGTQVCGKPGRDVHTAEKRANF